MNELEAKKEWCVYYPGNYSQKRLVYIDKNTVNALLVSMQFIHGFIEVYEGIFKIDGQNMLIDIENATHLFRDYQSDTEFNGCWLCINYNTAFMLIKALIVTKSALLAVNSCFTISNLVEKIESSLDLFDIKFWGNDFNPDNLPRNIKVYDSNQNVHILERCCEDLVVDKAFGETYLDRMNKFMSYSRKFK